MKNIEYEFNKIGNFSTFYDWYYIEYLFDVINRDEKELKKLISLCIIFSEFGFDKISKDKLYKIYDNLDNLKTVDEIKSFINDNFLSGPPEEFLKIDIKDVNDNEEKCFNNKKGIFDILQFECDNNRTSLGYPRINL